MKTLIVTFAALMFVLSAGCGSPVKPPLTARSDPYRSEQIHFTKEELRNRIAVGKVQLDRTEAGILQVNVQLRAAVDKTFPIDYRITFFDAAGRKLSSTGWQDKTLSAKTFEYISANSLTAEAKDFQMDLRYAE